MISENVENIKNKDIQLDSLTKVIIIIYVYLKLLIFYILGERHFNK